MSTRGSRTGARFMPRTALVWIAVVVVVLVVIDVVLVVLALGRTAPEQHGPAGPIPTFSSSPRPSGTSTPEPNGTSSPSDQAGASATDGRRLLTAVTATEAWRASAGTCGGTDPVLEHTTDGGTTWTAAALGADVRSLAALRATASRVSIVAAVGDDCTLAVRGSADDGATWTTGKAGDAGAAVHQGQVVLSSGAIASPCAGPVAASQGQYTTVVACEQQVDWRSGTGAWVAVPLTGVQAVVDAGSTYRFARYDADSCAGLQIVSLPGAGMTASSQATSVGCWAGGGDAGPAVIAMAGTAMWAWAGDEVAVSANGGATW